MNRAERWLLRAIGFGLFALIGVSGYEVWSNGEQAKSTQQSVAKSTTEIADSTKSVASILAAPTQQLATTVQKLGIAVDGFNSTLEAVNRPCGMIGKPCGTLADINRALGTFRHTVGEVEVAADHFDGTLGTLDRQEAQLYEDTHTALNNLSGTFTDASSALQQGRNTFATLNDFLKGKAINQTVTNLAGVTGNMNDVTFDFKNKFHAVLYPPPCKGRACWVKRAFTYGKAGVQFAEPTYYFEQLLVNR